MDKLLGITILRDPISGIQTNIFAPSNKTVETISSRIDIFAKSATFAVLINITRN